MKSSRGRERARDVLGCRSPTSGRQPAPSGRREGRNRRRLIRPATSAFLSLVFSGCGGERATPVAPSAPDTVAPTTPDTVVASIRITPSERTIGFLGTQFHPFAEALAADGTTLYRTAFDPGRFVWSSSAPEIASVSRDSILSNGGSTRTVTGLSDGTATISATSQGVTGRLTVTVRERARLAWSVPLEWSFPDAVAPILIGAGVTIGADGTIYVGWNDDPAQTSHWYALSPQGGILWTLDVPGRTTWGMPAIGADGTLYFGSNSGSWGSLVAVDPGGSIRWILNGLDAINSSPALGPDGTIYVAGGRHVHAVDPQGEIRWTYETPVKNFFTSSPALASDGTIYVGGDDHALHAINRDGSPRWTFKTENLVRAPPSIGADDTIYVPSHDGRLYAVNPDGSERWSVVVNRPPSGFEGSRASVDSPPSIGPDGAIYVLGRGLFAINRDGSIRWHFHSSTSGYRTTPILGADGNVYLASGPAVTALDAQGRLLWDYEPGSVPWDDHFVASPAIGIDGTIIAASVSETDGGTIHGIVEMESANGGYAGSPWPTQRGNRANTGRAGG